MRLETRTFPFECMKHGRSSHDFFDQAPCQAPPFLFALFLLMKKIVRIVEGGKFWTHDLNL